MFASLWAWAAISLSGFAPGLIMIPIAISLALLASGWRGSLQFPSRGRHVGKVVALWSSIEIVALLVTANVVQALHRGELMLPLGAIIVGLHFFPLARNIPARLYHATGAGLVAVGLVGLALPSPQKAMVVGIGAALVLWATALMIVARARKQAPSPFAV